MKVHQEMLRDGEGKGHYLTLARGQLVVARARRRMSTESRHAGKGTHSLFFLLPWKDHKPQTAIRARAGPQDNTGDPRVLLAEQEYLCLLSKLISSHTAASFKDFPRKYLTEGVPPTPGVQEAGLAPVPERSLGLCPEGHRLCDFNITKRKTT